MKRLDKETIQLAKQLDCFEVIYAISDIGALTTAMIIGAIGDITQFKSNKQLNAYEELISNDINQEIMRGHFYMKCLRFFCD